jgi:hypothetical protein
MDVGPGLRHRKFWLRLTQPPARLAGNPARTRGLRSTLLFHHHPY